ncbi:MAG: ABC transporter ATP-binding protein [Thermodesulfobacteriota bacterium]|jgi:branched-chain amino acid transport system ATP-binding protein
MTLLEVKDIHSYYGKSHILQGVSLNVVQDEVLCLLGRNGAGKTTTLKSIIGLVLPKQGSIRFKEKEIVGKEPFEIARLGIGYVPEDRRVYPDLTIKENLDVIPQRQVPQKERWSVEKIFALFPVLKKLQGSKGMELSGGEQQMLTIARTLMGNPEILLLDEPSEGLAPMIVKELEHLIRRIKAHTTILLVEQNSRFAIELSDRGYIIEKGKIYFEGNIEDLKKNSEIKERYLAV